MTAGPRQQDATALYRRSLIGRADLARLLGSLDPDAAIRGASRLGFELPLAEPIAPPALTAAALGEVAPFAPTSFKSEAPPIPLFRLERMTFTELPPSSPSVVTTPLSAKDLTSPGYSLAALPGPPLAPWPRLWPRLRSQLEGCFPSCAPDVAALVRSLSRGEILRRVPRLPRRAWASRASLWVDRSRRLIPFWADQDEVVRRLERLCGKGNLVVRNLDPGYQARSIDRRADFLAGVRIDPLAPLLVLGDLGLYGSATERAAWLRTARRLHHAGGRISALVPCPAERLNHPVARACNASPWEHDRARPPIFRGGPEATAKKEPAETPDRRALRLLQLASPAAVVQPGLLRALRRLLPSDLTDVAAEVDAWNHAAVRAADASGLVLHDDDVKPLREELAKRPEFNDPLLGQVSQAIRRWHEHWPRELLHMETLIWHSLFGDRVPPPGDLEEALAFAHRLATSSRQRQGTAGVEARGLYRRILYTLPREMNEHPEIGPLLGRLFGAVYEKTDDVPLPDGLDWRWIDYGPDPPPAEQWWAIRQVGDALTFSPLPESGAWASHEHGPGSPLAWLLAARPYLSVTRMSTAMAEESRERLLGDPLTLPLAADESITIESDRCSITLAPWHREPWAKAAGHDRFGLWADAEIAGVVQRFRWIPPGRFRMGSPESEQGRYGDEGPVHTVTFTQGRWLADTPVTQELWEAVMGKSPSQFKHPAHPVEQVSWDDCGKFMAAVNERAKQQVEEWKPEFEVRLPTEAEWEHACRAGTSTATWVGDLHIDGQGRAPELDPIAWYGGNAEQTTHPVARKAPNPNGLYDMLGNVWEWCIDMDSPYDAKDISDPRPVKAGSVRVFRGGSWGGHARRVRAAGRSWLTPVIRDSGLGLRLARGQVPSPAAERAPRSGALSQGTQSVPERRAAGRSPERAPAKPAPQKKSPGEP